MTHANSIRRIMFEARSVAVPPIIRLKGKWLVEAGFVPGERVEVSVSNPGELFVRRPKQTETAAEAKARALTAFAALGL